MGFLVQINDPIFRNAFWNLMNGIIGSGILALPYAMSNLGYLICTFAMILVATMTAFSVSNVLLCCQKANLQTLSYESLSHRLAGNKGKYLTILMIWLHTVIAMSSYVTVVKQQLPELFMVPLQTANTCVAKDSIWLNGNFIAFLVTILVIMPLSAMKKVDMLSFTSSLAMCLMGLFSLILFVFQWKIECPFVEASFETEAGTNNSTQTASTESEGPAGEQSCLDWQQVRQNNSKEYEPFTIAAQQIQEKQDLEEICYVSSIGDLTHMNAASALPNLVFSFMCITTVFPIFGDLTEAIREKENYKFRSSADRHEAPIGNLVILSKARKIMTDVTKFTVCVVGVMYWAVFENRIFDQNPNF